MCLSRQLSVHSVKNRNMFLANFSSKFFYATVKGTIDLDCFKPYLVALTEGHMVSKKQKSIFNCFLHGEAVQSVDPNTRISP